MNVDHPVPLARLFAMAFRSLIDDLHAELARRGWPDVRPAYGFVLLACREETMGGSDVAQLMDMTKQAASKLLESMEADGYVERTLDSQDARRQIVLLTSRGERLLAEVERIYEDLEDTWSRRIGRAEVERLRGSLLDVLGDDDGTLPAVRPLW